MNRTVNSFFSWIFLHIINTEKLQNLFLQSINLSAHKFYMFTTFVKFIQGNLMLKPITCQHTSVYTHFESIKPAGQIVNINTFAITKKAYELFIFYYAKQCCWDLVWMEYRTQKKSQFKRIKWMSTHDTGIFNWIWNEPSDE